MNFKEFMAAKYPDIEPSGIVFLAMKATWNACKEECAKLLEQRIKERNNNPKANWPELDAKAIREQL